MDGQSKRDHSTPPPKGHPGRFFSLDNLGNALYVRSGQCTIAGNLTESTRVEYIEQDDPCCGVKRED